MDEAWRSGVILAEGVIELLKAGKPFTKENLEGAYVARRRKDPQDKALQQACYARDGFQKSFMSGLMGTGMCGITGGKIHLKANTVPPSRKIKPLESLIGEKLTREQLDQIVDQCAKEKKPLHDAIMTLAA